MAGIGPRKTTLYLNGTKVANLTRCGFTGVKAESIDITVLDDDSPFIRKRRGDIDAGQVDFELNFIPSEASQAAALFASMAASDPADATVDWVVEWSDGTTYPFRGHLASFGPSSQRGASPLSATGQIEIDGQPSFIS